MSTSTMPVTDRCPAYSSFFGVMGATSAMVFSGILNYIYIFLRLFIN